MKKFLIHSAKILGGALLLVSIFLWGFEKFFLAKTTTHAAYKLDKFYHFEDDILVLGSSRAEGSFLVDSMFPGQKAYNYGVVGTGNWLWRKQLMDLSNNGKQELILVNVDPDSLSSGVPFDPNSYLNVPRKSAVFQGLDRKTRMSIGPFPFKYFGRIVDLTRTGIKEWFGITAYVNQGTNIPTKRVNERIFYSRPITKEGQLFCDSAEVAELKALFASSEDRIVFVKLPAFGEAANRQFFREMQLAFADYPKLQFVDMSGTLQEKRFWIDHAHVSFSGAEAVADMLLDSLSTGVAPEEVARALELRSAQDSSVVDASTASL